MAQGFARPPEDPAEREAMRRAVESRARGEAALEHERERDARLRAAGRDLLRAASRGRRLAAAVAGSRAWGALAAVAGRGSIPAVSDARAGAADLGQDPPDVLRGEIASGEALARRAATLRRDNHRLIRRNRTLEHGAGHLPRSAIAAARRLAPWPQGLRGARRSTGSWAPRLTRSGRAMAADDVSVVVVGPAFAAALTAIRLWRSPLRPRELILAPAWRGGVGRAVATAARRARGAIVAVTEAGAGDPARLAELVAALRDDPLAAASAPARVRFDWIDAAPRPVRAIDGGSDVPLGGRCAALRRGLLVELSPCPDYSGELWLTDLSLQASARGHPLLTVPDGASPPAGFPAADVALLLRRWGPALRSRILDDLLEGGGSLCPRPARVLVARDLQPSVSKAVAELGLEQVEERQAADVAIGVEGARLTFDWLAGGERVAADAGIAAEEIDDLDAVTLGEALTASASEPAFCVQIGSRDWEAANRGGDAPLARSLAKALARRGHGVLIQVGAETDAPAGLCLDVLLTLRGRAAGEPTPGRINLLWLISHPSEVPLSELDRYDRVLVASRPHAERLRGRIRPPVEPLLQFTDPELFHPDHDPTKRHEIAFVGNWRSALRRIVWDALATGRPLALYGRGWERIAPGQVVAEHLPHSALRRVYSSCDVLLCDHWDDMREGGFVSNRVFDALACGAFVIADDNAAIAAELPGAVVTYTDARDLRAKLASYLAAPAARAEHARRGRAAVLERHTADRRVDDLLAVVSGTRWKPATAPPRPSSASSARRDPERR